MRLSKQVRQYQQVQFFNTQSIDQRHIQLVISSNILYASSDRLLLSCGLILILVVLPVPTRGCRVIYIKCVCIRVCLLILNLDATVRWVMIKEKPAEHT